MAKQIFITKKTAETAVLISVMRKADPPEQAEEYLDELAFLADTAGAVIKKRFLQKLTNPQRLFCF